MLLILFHLFSDFSQPVAVHQSFGGGWSMIQHLYDEINSSIYDWLDSGMLRNYSIQHHFTSTLSQLWMANCPTFPTNLAGQTY